VGAGRILLDNFSPGQTAEAVRRVAGRARVECSGGLRPGNLRTYAEAGADFLSLGWLTHSAPAADLSLEIVPETEGEAP
jgi:nicotinate-nucleotide pyrophosphorylase (carboxylating)